MKMKQISEHDIQCQFIQWANLNLNKYPQLKLLYAVPNGGQRHIQVATKLKKEGVKAGVWDLSLDWPSNGYHGLKIETKRPKEGLTGNQEIWEERYAKAGYKTVICHSLDDFIQTIQEYLR